MLRDFGIILTLLFSLQKARMYGTEIISAEPIADWSDPGQLTFISYPVYV